MLCFFARYALELYEFQFEHERLTAAMNTAAHVSAERSRSPIPARF